MTFLIVHSYGHYDVICYMIRQKIEMRAFADFGTLHTWVRQVPLLTEGLFQNAWLWRIKLDPSRVRIVSKDPRRRTNKKSIHFFPFLSTSLLVLLHYGYELYWVRVSTRWDIRGIYNMRSLLANLFLSFPIRTWGTEGFWPVLMQQIQQSSFKMVSWHATWSTPSYPTFSVLKTSSNDSLFHGYRKSTVCILHWHLWSSFFSSCELWWSQIRM